MKSQTELLWRALILFIAAQNSACVVKDDCPSGSRGCPCAESGGCARTDLTCVDDVCIVLDGTNGSGASGAVSSAGSPGSGAQTSSGGAAATGEPGPEVECPFSEPNGAAILIEELSNPVNDSNGVSTPWWRPLQFGTRGGLLQVGDTACTPATVMNYLGAPCFQGYDCGGCLMMFGREDSGDYYFQPEDELVEACAPLAGFYGVYPGAEEPVHACDLEFPQGPQGVCLCADGEKISMTRGAVTIGGIFCGADDVPDPHEPGTNDWCALTYTCGTGTNTCEAWVSIQIDRATGEETFSVGNSCGLASGDVYQAANCPDYAAASSACASCVDACAGVPECYCTAECENPDYSCVQ